jgi:hypothetical protein
MKKMYYSILIFLVSFCSIAQESGSQTRNILIVSGNITDNNGLPLTGASVVIKGSTLETTTNFDGTFSLDVVSGSIISISYKGFKTIEVVIEPHSKINFVLSEKYNPLDLDSNQVSKSITRAEMRKLKRANNKKTLGAPVPDAEFLFGALRAIAKN